MTMSQCGSSFLWVVRFAAVKCGTLDSQTCEPPGPLPPIVPSVGMQAIRERNAENLGKALFLSTQSLLLVS